MLLHLSFTVYVMSQKYFALLVSNKKAVKNEVCFGKNVS